MRKISRCAVFLALFGFAHMWLGRMFGPQYQGKSASEWLSATEDHKVSLEQSTNAFRHMGTKGAVFLASRVTGSQEWYSREWYTFLSRHGLSCLAKAIVPRQGQTNGTQHGDPAAALLRMLGENAAVAFDAVWKLFQQNRADDSSQGAIVDVLASMPNELTIVVPQLVTDVCDTNRTHRTDCISLLGSLGPKAKFAVPVLTNAAFEPGEIGRSAALALWKISYDTNVVVNVLSNNLVLGDYLDIDATLNLIKRAPELQGLVSQEIDRLFDRPNLLFQLRIEHWLMEIEPTHWKSLAQNSWADPQPVVRNLLAKIAHGQDPERILAVQKLRLLGPRAEAAVPALVQILRDWNPTENATGGPFRPSFKNKLASAVLSTLPEFGSSAEPAADVLAELLDRDASRTEEYCRDLGAIGPSAKRVIPMLNDMLDTNVSDETVNINLKPIPPRLQRSLDIAGAMCLIDRRATNAVALLVRFCSQTNLSYYTATGFRLRCRSELVLYKIGALKSLPSPQWILSDALYNSSTIELLGDMGPAARSALPFLTAQFIYDDYGGSVPLMLNRSVAIRKIAPEVADKLFLPGVFLLPDYIHVGLIATSQ